MRNVSASCEILDDLNGDETLKKIERIPEIFDDLEPLNDVNLLVKNPGRFCELDPNRCQDGPKIG